MRKVFQQWRRSDSREWVPGRNIFVALLQFLYYVGIYFAHFHSTCRLLLIFNFFENKNLQDWHCVFQTPWQFLAAMIVLLRRVYNAINIPFLRVITDWHRAPISPFSLCLCRFPSFSSIHNSLKGILRSLILWLLNGYLLGAVYTWVTL